MSALGKSYKAFFEDTEAGKLFMQNLTVMISSKHEQSEKNPESARDNSQQAYGIREVENYIKTAMAGKGGKPK